MKMKAKALAMTLTLFSALTLEANELNTLDTTELQGDTTYEESMPLEDEIYSSDEESFLTDPPRRRRPPRRPPGRPPFPEPPRNPGYVQYIRCESRDHRYNECWFSSRWVRSVRLVQQHSRANCIRGRDYGVTHRFIWVDNGCRATFAVRGY